MIRVSRSSSSGVISAWIISTRFFSSWSRDSRSAGMRSFHSRPRMAAASSRSSSTNARTVARSVSAGAAGAVPVSGSARADRADRVTSSRARRAR